MEYSTYLKEFRESKGVKTIYAFKKRSGVAHGVIKSIEEGVSSPRVSTLCKLLESIDSDILEFFRFCELKEVSKRKRK